MNKKSKIKSDHIVVVIEKIAAINDKNKIQKKFINAFNSVIIDENFLNRTLDNEDIIENISDISDQVKAIPNLNKETWGVVKVRLLGKQIAHEIKNISEPNEIQKGFLKNFENDTLGDEFIKINYVEQLHQNVKGNLILAVLDVEETKNTTKDWWKKYIKK